MTVRIRLIAADAGSFACVGDMTRERESSSDASRRRRAASAGPRAAE